MDELDFEFTAKLWLYQGKGAWHFITVPREQSDQIKFFTSAAVTGRKKRGWGSVRITAKIGESQWQTSIFPSKSGGKLEGRYILPVKKDIRIREKIYAEDDVTVRLTIKTGL